MNCSDLTKDLVAAECNTSVTAGLEDDVILLNFNDVDKTKSDVEDNIISKIAMKPIYGTDGEPTGKSRRGYSFTTFGKSMDEAGATFVKGTYRNTWQHTLPLKIFVKNEGAKEFVNTFAAGTKVIAIIKNKELGKDGDVKYEAYGWDNGLELNESTNTVAMADGVVYSLTLGTSETAQEGSLPKSIFATDIDSTEEIIESLTKE